MSNPDDKSSEEGKEGNLEDRKARYFFIVKDATEDSSLPPGENPPPSTPATEQKDKIH